jgi:hypothetical protein
MAVSACADKHLRPLATESVIGDRLESLSLRQYAGPGAVSYGIARGGRDLRPADTLRSGSGCWTIGGRHNSATAIQ